MTGATLGTLNSFQRLLSRFGVEHRSQALRDGNKRRWTVGQTHSQLAQSADDSLLDLVSRFSSWKQAERKFIKLVRDMSEIEVTLHRPSTPSTSYILNARASDGSRKYGDTVYRKYVLKCCFPLRVGSLKRGASSYLFNSTAVKIYKLAVERGLTELLAYLSEVFGYMHARYLKLVSSCVLRVSNKQYPVSPILRPAPVGSSSLALAGSREIPGWRLLGAISPEQLGDP